MVTVDEIEQLRQLMTVNGRSFSNPVYKEGTQEIDMANPTGRNQIPLKGR